MVYLESPQRDDEAKRMTAPSTSGESAVFRQAMREFAAGVAIVAAAPATRARAAPSPR